MSPFMVIMACFAMVGAADRILGNRFGLGKEFERGFNILGSTILSMVGMIVLAPWLAQVLEPFFAFLRDTLQMDPSIVPAVLFANDMGGASLSQALASDTGIGSFNALVVSAMMGCTVSFTIPYALEVVDKKYHHEMLVGMLCGIMTIPFGCFVAGVVQGLPMGLMLMDLLPLAIFAVIIAIGLMRSPDMCVKIFGAFGTLMKIAITIGLALAMLDSMLGIKLVDGLAPMQEGVDICVNACVVLAGTFPLMAIVARILRKPMRYLGDKLGVSEVSALGLIGSMATSRTTFEAIPQMDKKGVMLNAAFCVSGAFVFGGHLAFTMAIDATLIEEMIIGKLVAGVLSVIAADLVYRRMYPAGK